MKDILDNDLEQKAAPRFKLKHAIIIFLFGWIIGLLGALFKLESWPMGSELLLVSYAIKLIGVALILYKVITIRNKNSVLNK